MFLETKLCRYFLIWKMRWRVRNIMDMSLIISNYFLSLLFKKEIELRFANTFSNFLTVLYSQQRNLI